MLLLSGEHGPRLLRQVKSALGLGLRPSAHILCLKKPASDWSIEDHSLAETFQIMQDETCPQCGEPIWVCRSRDNNLDYPVMSDICRVEQSKAKWKKTLKDGEFLYVRPRMRDPKAPFVTREQYFDSLEEENKIHSKANTLN